MSALALALLGVNKQLDLQVDLMRWGKAWATARGLYPDHRAELMLAVGALALLGLVVAIAVIAWLARRRLSTIWLAALGWLAIAAFIALRAALFHHLDELGLAFLRGAGVVLLEIGGLVAIGLAVRKTVSFPLHADE